MKSIAEQITLARESLGMKKATLARRMGTNRSNITRWEAGKTCPSGKQLVELSRVLGIDFGIKGTGTVYPDTCFLCKHAQIQVINGPFQGNAYCLCPLVTQKYIVDLEGAKTCEYFVKFSPLGKAKDLTNNISYMQRSFSKLLLWSEGGL